MAETRGIVLVMEPVADAGLQRLANAGMEVVDHRALAESEREEALRKAHALVVRSGTQVDAALMDRASNLRAVARAGVGLDNVDLEEATRRGIAVMNTPGGNSVAAAEHTVALMLALARHVAQAHGALERGEWNRHQFVGVELAGRRLGLFGMGRVGSLVAQRARAFDMRVSACDPYLSGEKAESLGVRKVELDELLASCDVLSLHLPLTDATRHVIDAAALSRMKAGALLVNCARGGLVDEAALADSLREGHLAGAAVDVFGQEPPSDSPLLGLPNVVHTPHLGASTREAKENVSVAIARALVALFRDDDYSAAVNLPFAGGDLRRMAPLLDLARRLGRFQASLLDGAPRKIEVVLATDDEADEPRPLAQAFLSGLLEIVCGGEVNAVNAQLKADELGIVVSQGRAPAKEGYPRLLSTRVSQGDRAREVDGGMLAPDSPRIVRVDGYWMDAEPVGEPLLMWNADRPGVIGKVGTLLGERGINIGEMRLGRASGSDEAISVWQVDQAVEADVLEALMRIPEIEDVRQVRLGPSRSHAH